MSDTDVDTGAEPELAVEAPEVPAAPADPGVESETVLAHRAKLKQMDEKRGF